MSKPSVLMVISKYPPDFGHNTVINNLCKCLNELGCRTAIGAFSFDSDPPYHIEKIILSKTKLLTSGVNYLNFDVIHSHQPRMNYYLLFKKPEKPIIMHVHGASTKIHEINFKLSMLFFKNRIKKTIAVSNSNSEIITELVGKIPIEIIYNGVNTDIYTPNLPETYKKGSPQLLFVSGLRKYKNANVLISLMPKIMQIFPQVHLQIIGDGVEYENLKNLILEKNLEANVELVGKIIDEKELRQYYASCDLYISASSLEACPVSPFEAMSCGKPLVLYGINPHKEIIEASSAGLIFDSLNEDEICKKIHDAYKNRMNFGKNGRDFAIKHSWQNASKKLIGIYEEITKN